MTSQNDENHDAGLRGPGDPDAVDLGQPHPDSMKTKGARNIREEQQTQAAGSVPAAYVGSGDPDAEHKPEEAAQDAGTWDENV
ncbi:hypothetical protein [Arthrobacter sp. 92]|uniref:hypothetical protein n=1 Tax=Arthrobacter sp. 92 TaxID=3418175 RepID=UPI003CFFB054